MTGHKVELCKATKALKDDTHQIDNYGIPDVLSVRILINA